MFTQIENILLKRIRIVETFGDENSKGVGVLNREVMEVRVEWRGIFKLRGETNAHRALV
jgi:hypothetical protein